MPGREKIRYYVNGTNVLRHLALFETVNNKKTNKSYNN